MFKKILIVTKDGISEKDSLIKNLKEIFKDSSVSVKNYSDFGKKGVYDVGLIITLGGDGTFVRVANFVEDCFILGVNYAPEKSEGFLTTIDKYHIDDLKNLINGKYKTENWQRAKILLNGKEIKEKAINEVFVGVATQHETARYVLRYRNKKEEQRSSGVIVVTGTGSNAWYKSAGGKEFEQSERKLKFIVREPYFGKRLFKPTILSGEIGEGEKIAIESARADNGILAINEAVYDFNKGSVAEIMLSDKPLKVLRV